MLPHAAYDRVGGPKMVHVACWAHSRRRFVEATKLNQQDVASARIVAPMAKLFAIDAEARDEKMDHSARHALHIDRATSLLPELEVQSHAGCDVVISRAAPAQLTPAALSLLPGEW